ncbi:penicillin-binding protein [Candidatus Saccharibacteria bacterium]|nr:penicillin-binding protein [Candidatus Saccharibacteria bacterium]
MVKKTASIKKAITKKRNVKQADKEAQKAVSSRSRSKNVLKSGMKLYSNLAYKRRVKEDQRARRKAEELATLPKNPVLRFFARLRPDRFFRWWFSKDNQIRLLKIVVAFILLIIIGIGGLFLYYKKDLAEINPEELASRVQDTVNTYLDRNGEVLWEDKGDGDYRLVVDGSEISTYMRQATVAIEDKNFYNHIGIDFGALVRAAFYTLSGKQVQGGSTLTQQLIKQVYFSDEAKDRGIGGIPRKIKEAILSIEVEKMYDKEQIITLYLNESPYGGRRNGVESAARTYFGKSAKDLDLAESALLAAVPNNPAILNPYNEAGHEALIKRQHKVLNSMVEMNYITQEQADEAKAIDIIAKIKPESDQYANIKAPWFVLEVKSQLEAKYGIKTMREGGFTIKTTLDYRAQKIAENAVKEGMKISYMNSSDNATLVSVDVETSQVIAMVGSADWKKAKYGQVNAATSLLEPASSIKPILDYTPLFMQRSGMNFGPGTVLRDENIDRIYCNGTSGSCKLRNASGKFYGNTTIRQALAGSLNIPAVKALRINTIENSLEIAHKLGDVSYCANGEQAGLSMAIGGGCAVRPVEHANAYASLARGGVYKDLAYVLEVKNATGDVIEAWTDTEGDRVVDEQVAYMTTSILSDAPARRFTFGSLATYPGFYSNKVWFAAKTGTTENGRGKAKDSWIVSYSPVLATAIWNGNHDGRPISSGNHYVAFKISEKYIEKVHTDVYGKDGKWKSGDKIKEPAGMKHMSVNGKNDIWPSWYDKKKSSGISEEKMTFDSISKKKATDCTPAETRVEATVSKMIDPMTEKEIYYSGEYDTEKEDDVHQCSDKKPGVSVSQPTGSNGNWTISFVASNGRYSLQNYSISINGTNVKNGELSASGGTITYASNYDTINSVSVTVKDSAGYTATNSWSVPESQANGN